MCHSRRWQEWELLNEERREDEEPRVVEVAPERELEPVPEPERERDPERELIRV
jgi:hypothetical protein